MLKLFEVSGFKSFKDTMTFNFSDVREYQFHKDCLSQGRWAKRSFMVKMLWAKPI